MFSISRLINSKVSACVVMARSSSSGDHAAAERPASTDPPISTSSSVDVGFSLTRTISPPAKIKHDVEVSAKWCKLKIESWVSEGSGHGASHDAMLSSFSSTPLRA